MVSLNSKKDSQNTGQSPMVRSSTKDNCMSLMIPNSITISSPSTTNRLVPVIPVTSKLMNSSLDPFGGQECDALSRIMLTAVPPANPLKTSPIAPRLHFNLFSLKPMLPRSPQSPWTLLSNFPYPRAMTPSLFLLTMASLKPQYSPLAPQPSPPIKPQPSIVITSGSALAFLENSSPIAVLNLPPPSPPNSANSLTSN